MTKKKLTAREKDLRDRTIPTAEVLNRTEVQCRGYVYNGVGLPGEVRLYLNPDGIHLHGWETSAERPNMFINGRTYIVNASNARQLAYALLGAANALESEEYATQLRELDRKTPTKLLEELSRGSLDREEEL